MVKISMMKKCVVEYSSKWKKSEGLDKCVVEYSSKWKKSEGLNKLTLNQMATFVDIVMC